MCNENDVEKIIKMVLDHYGYDYYIINQPWYLNHFLSIRKGDEMYELEVVIDDFLLYDKKNVVIDFIMDLIKQYEDYISTDEYLIEKFKKGYDGDKERLIEILKDKPELIL